MRPGTFIAALVGGSILASAAWAEPVKTTFDLVGQSFNLTLPDGFCPPTGANEAKATMVSSAVGQQAVVNALFFPCTAGQTPHSVAYGLVAAPKGALLMVMPPRAELVAQMKAKIADGSLAEAIHSGGALSTAEKAMKSASGKDIQLSGDPKFVETDANAAYIAGAISAQVEGQTRAFLMVGAVTVAKGRMIDWYLYSPDTSTAAAADMLAQLKGYVARFIADNGG